MKKSINKLETKAIKNTLSLRGGEDGNLERRAVLLKVKYNTEKMAEIEP